MKRWALIGWGTAACMAGAHGFEMNLTPAEARSKLALYAVQDLVVGDSGRLRALSFCIREGELFLPADALLTDYKGSYSFVVTREPNDTVSLRTVIDQPDAAAGQNSREADETIARALLHAYSIECAGDAPTMSISTVNDHISFDELLDR